MRERDHKGEIEESAERNEHQWNGEKGKDRSVCEYCILI